MGNFITRLFNEDERRLHKIERKIQPVLDLAEEYKNKSDADLQAMTPYLKKKLADGATLDDIYVEAFATAREACRRVIGEYPYPVQLMGATVMQGGDLAEMATGSGKTLTSVMAVYLNALEGKGVHVVTVNEYLAQRDAEWMGGVHRWLGLTVGLNLQKMTAAQKRAAYACDITYSTNSELGFDYLRDNMVISKEDRVLRGLHFALIDEADSVLIDDSRTPLIISSQSNQDVKIYFRADAFAKSLKPEDYEIDIKTKGIQLTEQGIEKAEKYFKLANLYDLNNTNLLHRINNALKAVYTMSADVDYVADREKQEIFIVDPNTGRIMEGRQWSNGLHQAVEAKEGIQIKQETTTAATITYQNFFRLYDKLAGMTGTAKTEEDEFLDIYNMYVVPVPTNEPVIRIDHPDIIFGSKKAKYQAIVEEVENHYKKGQPVLLGTIAIETSELLSRMLTAKRIPHNVLNAKNHAKEAEIIAKAGQKYAVTIATNMAGRGTDIKLGEGVRELGGLCVIGSERHESRRIDNQLRGRAGRQGDPGMSRFFISTEDDLLQRFSTERVKMLYDTLGDECVESKSISRSISNAQKRVESVNYDARKRLLQYDDVMRQQRETMYKQRDYILDNECIHPMIRDEFHKLISDIVARNVDIEDASGKLDVENIMKQLGTVGVSKNIDLDPEKIASMNELDATEFIFDRVWRHYDEAVQPLTEYKKKIEKLIALRTIDLAWRDHIDAMDKFRNGVGLRSYAQSNPIQAYIKEGFAMFETMMSNIATDIARSYIAAVNEGERMYKEQHPEA